jgi:hypothetical protein
MVDRMFRSSLWKLLGLLLLLTAALASQPAIAQEPGCIDDLTDRENVCAANDIEISTLYSAQPGSCFPGDMVTLNLIARLVATSLERYDIGIFLALDGGNADTGLCHHGYLPPPLAAGGTCSGSGDDCNKDADCPLGQTCTGGYYPGSLELPGGPFYDGEPDDAPDECGDLEQGVETYYHYLTSVAVECVDSDGDGYLDIGTAVSWDNKKDNTCEDVGDALPNTKAKCRFGRVNIANVTVIPGAIQVQKSPQPAQILEPGGWVTFTFAVENTTRTTVTLDSMVDSVYGPLDQWADGNCSVPQTLGPAALYSCAITAEVTGDPGIYEDTVTVVGTDWYQGTVSGTATAEVLLVALAPELSVVKVADPTTIEEPGGAILYSITVTNGSEDSDPMTLTSLVDDPYGNLADPTNPAISASTCELVTIQPQQAYSCTFTAVVSGVVGNTITDTVTVTATDDEGEEAQASDDATVTIVAEPPPTGMGMPAAVVAGGTAVVGLGLLLVGVLLRRRTA